MKANKRVKKDLVDPKKRYAFCLQKGNLSSNEIMSSENKISYEAINLSNSLF